MTTPVTDEVQRFKFENGWTVIECEDERGTFISRAKNADGMMRATAMLTYVPSERIVKCYHYAGADARQRKDDLLNAFANASRGKMHTQPGCWSKQRRKDKRTWMFFVSIGGFIDEEEEFASIAAQFEDEIFTSIVMSSDLSV